MDGAKTRDRILPPHPRVRAEDLPHLRRTPAFAPKTSHTSAGNAESKEKTKAWRAESIFLPIGVLLRI
jgi:hypothetical protein